MTVGAQVTTADVVGKVTDNTGAVIPNARVILVNKETNIPRIIQTNESGDYVINLLSTGRYSVRVEALGFKTLRIGELALAAGDRRRVDMRMDVGEPLET